MTFDKHGILCVAAAIMCVPMDANSVRLKRRITVLRTFVLVSSCEDGTNQQNTTFDYSC